MEMDDKYCNDPDCEESFKPHYWGALRAHSQGWMIQKDGTAWCPKHLPYWVHGWRQRAARLKRDSEDK